MRRPFALPSRTEASTVMPTIRSVKLRRDDIQTLLGVLNGILMGSSRSALDANDIWNSVYNANGDLPHITSCEDFLESFRASRSQSRTFKGILCTLRALTDSLEEAIERTEERIETIAMHLGLARLPDELLSRILWHAASTLSEAVELCEVCTRFRSVLLSSPEIWAKFPLTVNTTSRQITTIVERSGVVPLKARIEPIIYFAPNVNDVLDHSARLQELIISPVNDPILRSRFDAIHLPVLSYLGMTWSKYIRNAQNGFGQPNVHIYETWTMPHLRFLEANFVPHPLPGTGIVQCELSFDEDSIHVDDLLSFLGSPPGLKKIKLSFVHTSAWQGDMPDPAVNLPNLRSLSIHASAKTSTSLLNRILSNLSCENVSEVSFDMKASSWMNEIHHHAFDMGYEIASSVEDTDFVGWSRAAIQFMQRQKHLRSLSVAVDVTQRRGDDKSVPPIVAEAIRDILSNIPCSLETFVLSNCITVCWKSMQGNCRQIDYIRVTDANSYTIGLLQTIKTIVLQQSLGPGRIITLRHIKQVQLQITSIPSRHFYFNKTVSAIYHYAENQVKGVCLIWKAIPLSRGPFESIKLKGPQP